MSDPLLSFGIQLAAGTATGILSVSAAKIFDKVVTGRGGTTEEQAKKEAEAAIRAAGDEDFKHFYKPLFERGSDLRALCLEGIRLRRDVVDGDRLVQIRNRIIKRYDLVGMHVVQAVQMGIPEMIRDDMQSKGFLPAAMTARIREFLSDIDGYCRFLHGGDRQDLVSREIVNRINARNPVYFAVAGSGANIALTREVAEDLEVNLGPIYDIQRRDETYRFAVLLRRKQ